MTDPSTGTATLTVQSSRLTAGGTVTVSGTGFASDERVEFTLLSTPRHLGGVSAGDAGSFTAATLTIPADVAPGDHTLRAVGATSGKIATIAVTVSAAGVAADAPTPLAGTGVDVLWPAGLAALLLAGGAVLVLSRRRPDGLPFRSTDRS